MKNTNRYNKFVKEVLEELGNDEVREDNEKTCQILKNYFSKSEFTVYIFVYLYYTGDKDKHNEKKSEVELVMNAVMKALKCLVDDFDGFVCQRHMQNEEGEVGKKCTYHCEFYDEQKCSLSADDSIDMFDCYFYNIRYHVIRRIAKFYENLQSVYNYLVQATNNQNQYQNIKERFVGDFGSFVDDAFRNAIKEANDKIVIADKKIDEANEKIENADAKIGEATDKLNVALSNITVAGKKLEKVEKKIKKVKKVDKNLIAVMSIFVAAIIAIFMSTNFFTAIAGQVFEHDTIFGLFPVLIISLVSFAILNLIYFLFTYISAIVLEEESILLRQIKKIILIVDAFLLLMITILFGGLIVFQINL